MHSKLCGVDLCENDSRAVQVQVQDDVLSKAINSTAIEVRSTRPKQIRASQDTESR